MSPFAQLEEVDQLVRRSWPRIEASEKVDDLDNGQLRVERRRLETDPDARLERVGPARDVEAQDDRLAAVGRAQTLEDLDRRRLARAVRPEQAKDLAGRDIEIDPVDRSGVAVALDEAADANDRFPGARGGRALPRCGAGGQSFFRR